MRGLGFIAMALLLILAACANRNLQSSGTETMEGFDWQGHRGCRGLMPENTIPAFIEALNYPVSTLELDIVVSADSQLIVSHEPWMNPGICLDPDGVAIGGNGRQHNLYKMTAKEIKSFDCGSKINKKYPDQTHVPAYKPALSEVVSAVRAACKATGRDVPGFNIELRSHPSMYGAFVPEPGTFVQLVLAEIDDLGMKTLTTLQSFDLNILREIRRQAGDAVRISYLVSSGRDLRDAIDRLGFTPHVFSPHHRLASERVVKVANSNGILVIPWTVNNPNKMRKLICRGVHGIITDYPDRIPTKQSSSD